MTISTKQWKKLFLFCLGLFLAAGFCMKWMEDDFLQGGEKFTIMGLELFYPKQRVDMILAGLDGHVATLLCYHLSFDFAFMAGVFPGVAALCMMAREKTSNKALKKVLFLLALLQMVAWACDIYENSRMLTWVNNKATGNEFDFFHIVVASKWIIALAGGIVSIPLNMSRGKRNQKI
jgi:hypothetical protein